MESINLDKPMPPAARMFGGEGEVLAYRDLESISGVYACDGRLLCIAWSARGVGFGQAYLSDEEANAETMSRTFIASLLNRFVLDAAWSNEGYRDDVEPIVDLRVSFAARGDMAGFQYTCAAGAGVILLGKTVRNHGEVNFVEVTDSPLKSQAAVLRIIFAWLDQILSWS